MDNKMHYTGHYTAGTENIDRKSVAMSLYDIRLDNMTSVYHTSFTACTRHSELYMWMHLLTILVKGSDVLLSCPVLGIQEVAGK